MRYSHQMILAIVAVACATDSRSPAPKTETDAVGWSAPVTARLIFTTGLDRGREPINSVGVIPIDVERIYVYTKLFGLDTSRAYRYRAEVHDEHAQLVTRFDQTITPRSASWYVWSWYEPDARTDDLGRWEYKIYLDERLIREKTLLVTAPADAGSIDIQLQKPDGWTRDVLGWFASSGTEIRGVRDHVFCHPEPTPRLNTNLLVRVFGRPKGGASGDLLEDTLRRILERGQDVTVDVPITRAKFAGHPALFLEMSISGESPLDGSRYRGHERIWSVALGRRVILVSASQPAPPDPECSVALEESIRTMVLRYLGDQEEAPM